DGGVGVIRDGVGMGEPGSERNVGYLRLTVCRFLFGADAGGFLSGRWGAPGVVVAQSHSRARDRIAKWTLQRSGTNRLRARIVGRNSLSICLPSPTNLP